MEDATLTHERCNNCDNGPPYGTKKPIVSNIGEVDTVTTCRQNEIPSVSLQNKPKYRLTCTTRSAPIEKLDRRHFCRRQIWHTTTRFTSAPRRRNARRWMSIATMIGFGKDLESRSFPPTWIRMTSARYARIRSIIVGARNVDRVAPRTPRNSTLQGRPRTTNPANQSAAPTYVRSQATWL